MKQSVSFSKDEAESTSLNFSELREKGLEYIQELSGDIWTDYNSHDPGVTILEQLCYSLTDIGLRTSLPVDELLTPAKNVPVDPNKNAFFTPSAIFSSHPVTIMDMRKMIIDRFEEIQNVWITTKENKGYQEEIRGINQIEILPKLNFLSAVKSNPGLKDSFLNQVNRFLNENRNIGEKFEYTCLLEPQVIQVEFDIHMKEHTDVETSLANLFLSLFEFIYTPVQYHTLNEMEEEEQRLEEIFAGPRLSNGFIKNNLPGTRLKSVHIDELQKLFSKGSGINKSEVKSIIFQNTKYDSLQVANDKFFHLLVEGNSSGMTDRRFESIYSNMNVFINDKKITSLNKQSINNLFFEIWSKKHRGYSLNTQQSGFFDEKLKGTYRNPGNYFSIQRHFPILYGIGKEGLSKNDSEERHARANQLKAYLMLFEQHLANHLAQLANLNEFFNIDYKNGTGKTYFTQWLSSVPGIEKLAEENLYSMDSLEPQQVFFSRKNKIYDHLLARFGEDLSYIPWKIALRLNLITSEEEYNQLLLIQKSKFLMQLKDLSYNRIKGESFQQVGDNKISRQPSGLEQIVSVKTGIPERGSASLIPEFIWKRARLPKQEKHYKDIAHTKYKPLYVDDLNLADQQNENTSIPDATFGEIGIKTLFKDTLDLKNYRLYTPESSSEQASVIFQKEPNKWSHLFNAADKTEAVRNIRRIMDFFIEQNRKSEGLYLVDHILLSDFLAESKYGFTFLSEYGAPLFRTQEEESWSNSEKERNNLLALFFKNGLSADSYFHENGKWIIKSEAGTTLATYETQKDISEQQNRDKIVEQTTSLIQLFNDSGESNGRLRFKEMEKIRFMGTMTRSSEYFGQRRLVFQRKLSNGNIINEDFFDMNITVLMPDWPARFQDGRFIDYVNNIIHERIPTHIGNEIFRVNVQQLKNFEEKYFIWEKLKSEQNGSGVLSENLKKAAFEVYQQIMELKTKK